MASNAENISIWWRHHETPWRSCVVNAMTSWIHLCPGEMLFLCGQTLPRILSFCLSINCCAELKRSSKLAQSTGSNECCHNDSFQRRWGDFDDLFVLTNPGNLGYIWGETWWVGEFYPYVFDCQMFLLVFFFFFFFFFSSAMEIPLYGLLNRLSAISIYFTVLSWQYSSQENVLGHLFTDRLLQIMDLRNSPTIQRNWFRTKCLDWRGQWHSTPCFYHLVSVLFLFLLLLLSFFSFFFSTL